VRISLVRVVRYMMSTLLVANGSLGCVLDGILSEDQLQGLADCYGWDKDANLRFTGYPAHL
jgi:hypothetical protein